MKTFKTQIYLNQYAEAYCTRAFGVRRVVWNWALDQFLTGKKTTGQMPNNYDLDGIYRKKLKACEDPTFKWLLKQQTSPLIMMECLKSLVASFKLSKTQMKKNHTKGIHPQFKTKKDRLQTFSYYHSKDSYYRIDGPFTVSIGTQKGLPRCEFRTAENVGWMKSNNIKLCLMTVSKRAGKYWLSISYEKLNQTEKKPTLKGKVGIDLGVVKSAVTYDGNEVKTYQFNTEKSLHNERLSKRLDVKLSRMKKGSNRYEKLLLLKERREIRAANQRKALLEELTTHLANTYAEIVIDDFSFKSALSCKNLKNVQKKAVRQKAYRCMVYAFKERLAAKAADTRAQIRFAEHHKGVKTTMKCSSCGSERVSIDTNRIMTCPRCGKVIDRDVNAAINCYNL